MLLRHPAVLEVSVSAAPIPMGGEGLVAFVVRMRAGGRPGRARPLPRHIARFKRPKDYKFAPAAQDNYGQGAEDRTAQAGVRRSTALGAAIDGR